MHAFRGEHNGLTTSSEKKGYLDDTRGANLMPGKSPMPRRDKRSYERKKEREKTPKRATTRFTSLRRRRAQIINSFLFFYVHVKL